jgi:hypothetical protein
MSILAILRERHPAHIAVVTDAVRRPASHHPLCERIATRTDEHSRVLPQATLVKRHRRRWARALRRLVF